MNPEIWQLVSINPPYGKLYRSIPTDVPVTWKRRTNGRGALVYVSGQYVITREPYGKWRFSYRLKRNGVELFGLYSRLKDAKAHAEKNARGEETVNVA